MNVYHKCPFSFFQDCISGKFEHQKDYVNYSFEERCSRVKIQPHSHQILKLTRPVLLPQGQTGSYEKLQVHLHLQRKASFPK